MTIDLTSEESANTPRSRHHESMPAMAAQTQAAIKRRSGPSPLPVILSALVLAVVFAATHLLPIPGGKKAVTAAIEKGRLFDQSPSFGANEVLERLDGFGEQGRAAYQVMMYTSDVVFPLAILALLLLAARYLSQIEAPVRLTQAASLLAIAFFGADLIENAVIFHLLAIFPETSGLASVLGIVTSTKMAFLASAVLMLVLSAAGRVVMRR